MKELKFSLTLKSVPVEIDGKTYQLRELTGAQRDEYSDMSVSRLRFDDKGKVAGIKSVSGMTIKLLSMSLVDENGKPVPENVLKGWPANVVSALSQEAMELSGLAADEKATAEVEAAAKND